MARKPIPKRMAGFNIDEWVSLQSPRSGKDGFPDDRIRYSVQGKEQNPYIVVTFGKGMLEHLDPGKDMRAMVMRHRSDRNRMVVFSSPNGYRINKAARSREKYFIRLSNRKMEWPVVDSAEIIKPVLHPKGISGCTVIEIEIPKMGIQE